MQELLPSGTSLLMHGVPSQLQFMFKLLLNSLAADKHHYYLDRVRMALYGWNNIHCCCLVVEGLLSMSRLVIIDSAQLLW